MNVRQYGRHFSGYQHAETHRKPSERWPYLTTISMSVVFLTSFLYLCSHWWPEHPYGMTVAWVLFMWSLLTILSWAYRILMEDEDPSRKRRENPRDN